MQLQKMEEELSKAPSFLRRKCETKINQNVKKRQT